MVKAMVDTVMDIFLIVVAILVVVVGEIWRKWVRRRIQDEWRRIDLRSLTDDELKELVHKARLGEGTLAEVAYEMYRRGTLPKEAGK